MINSTITAYTQGMEIRPPLKNKDVLVLIGQRLLPESCQVEDVDLEDDYIGLIPYTSNTGNPMLDASDVVLPLSRLREGGMVILNEGVSSPPLEQPHL